MTCPPFGLRYRSPRSTSACDDRCEPFDTSGRTEGWHAKKPSSLATFAFFAAFASLLLFLASFPPPFGLTLRCLRAGVSKPSLDRGVVGNPRERRRWRRP